MHSDGLERHCVESVSVVSETCERIWCQVQAFHTHSTPPCQRLFIASLVLQLLFSGRLIRFYPDPDPDLQPSKLSLCAVPIQDLRIHFPLGQCLGESVL